MIFLPLTFFTGLLELNFATTADPVILPVSGRILFYALFGILIATVLWMAYFFKRKGWL